MVLRKRFSEKTGQKREDEMGRKRTSQEREIAEKQTESEM